MNPPAILLCCALAAALAACGGDATAPPPNEEVIALPDSPVAAVPDTLPIPPTPGAEATPANPLANISVDPGALPACDPPQVATVRWDFTDSHPHVSTIEIWAGPDDANPILFTSTGTVGEATTGTWARPGLVFRARDPASGQELARVAISGPDCPGS